MSAPAPWPAAWAAEGREILDIVRDGADRTFVLTGGKKIHVRGDVVDVFVAPFMAV